MRVVVSNSVGKGKLQFNDVKDRVLTEEVRRIDFNKGTSSISALNLENRTKTMRKILTKVMVSSNQEMVKINPD